MRDGGYHSKQQQRSVAISAHPQCGRIWITGNNKPAGTCARGLLSNDRIHAIETVTSTSCVFPSMTARSIIRSIGKVLSPAADLSNLSRCHAVELLIPIATTSPPLNTFQLSSVRYDCEELTRIFECYLKTPDGWRRRSSIATTATKVTAKMRMFWTSNYRRRRHIEQQSTMLCSFGQFIDEKS